MLDVSHANRQSTKTTGTSTGTMRPARSFSPLPLSTTEFPMNLRLPWSHCLFPVIFAVVILGLWYAVVLGFGIPTYLLPLPHEIVAATAAERGALGIALATTGRAALYGLVISAGAGFLLAVVLALSARLRWALYPYVLLLQTVPVVILTPVLVLWLGPGLPSVTAVTFLITFFPVTSNTVHGLLSTPHAMLDLFRVYDAGRLQEMLHLRIPYALPHYLSGLRIAASLAPIGAIAGEFFAGSSAEGRGGLGYLVIVYFSRHEIPALFATGLTACALGFTFVGAVAGLSRFALRRWHDSARPRE